MGRKTSFLESNHVVHCCPNGLIAANEDIFNGSPASDVISMKNAHNAVFVIVTNANAGGNATIRIFACSTAAAAATTPISFNYRTITAAATTGGDTQGTVREAGAAGFATSTGANKIYIIEVDSEVVAATGYGYIQLKTNEKTDAAVDGAIFGFLSNLRYKEDALATQLT